MNMKYRISNEHLIFSENQMGESVENIPENWFVSVKNIQEIWFLRRSTSIRTSVRFQEAGRTNQNHWNLLECDNVILLN